jgi:hypothetical protein
LRTLEAPRPPAAGVVEREPTCDFCAAAPAAWRYPARPDAVTVRTDDALVILQGGDWYACPVCSSLIEAAMWDALSQRAGLPLGQGEALWATFWASRTGPALPLDPRGRSDA